MKYKNILANPVLKFYTSKIMPESNFVSSLKIVNRIAGRSSSGLSTSQRHISRFCTLYFNNSCSSSPPSSSATSQFIARLYVAPKTPFLYVVYSKLILHSQRIVELLFLTRTLCYWIQFHSKTFNTVLCILICWVRYTKQVVHYLTKLTDKKN